MSYEVKVARTRRKLEAAVAKGDDEAVIDLKEKLSKRAAKLGRDEPGSREAAAAKAVLSSIAAAKKDGATKNKNKSSRGDGDVPARTIPSVACESVPVCISTSRSVIWKSTSCSGKPAEKTCSAKETISASGVLLAVAVCVRENHSMGIRCPPALRM